MPENKSRRRNFLKSAAAGILILKPATAFGSQANSTVEVGLIGCGGRGNWIVSFLSGTHRARVVALADVVKEHLDRTAVTFKVNASRAYYGPDAGRELAQSALDAVVMRFHLLPCGAGFVRGGCRQARVHGQARRGGRAGM